MPEVNSYFAHGGAGQTGFVLASTLDVMGDHDDLRKFITELPVAERGAVLSSGRELLEPDRRGAGDRGTWRRGNGEVVCNDRR